MMPEQLEKQITPQELAAEINRRGSYSRGDGRPVPGSQISARASKYPQLFVREGGQISLANGYEPPDRVKPPAGGTARPQTEPDEASFRYLGTVGDLIVRGLPDDPWLGKCGVYRIEVPDGYSPDFVPPDGVRAARNVVAPWSVKALRETNATN